MTRGGREKYVNIFFNKECRSWVDKTRLSRRVIDYFTDTIFSYSSKVGNEGGSDRGNKVESRDMRSELTTNCLDIVDKKCGKRINHRFIR